MRSFRIHCVGVGFAALMFVPLAQAEELTVPTTPTTRMETSVGATDYNTLTGDTHLVFTDSGNLAGISALDHVVAVEASKNDQYATLKFTQAVTAKKLKILKGRWIQEGGDLSGVEELWLSGTDEEPAGQFCAQKDTTPQAFFLGRSQYSESNAYGNASIRADGEHTFKAVTVLEGGTKISQSSGSSLTISTLKGPGDLTTAVYNGTSATLTVKNGSEYTGTLRPSGALTIGSDIGGGIALSNATLNLGNTSRTVKTLTLTDATLMCEALPTGGGYTPPRFGERNADRRLDRQRQGGADNRFVCHS